MLVTVLTTLLLAPVPTIAGHSGTALAATSGKAKTKVLYDARFQNHGLKGWRGDVNHWSVTSGAAVYAGGGTAGIFAPYRVKAHDFAVEATIEGDGPHFGLIVRRTGEPYSGIFALSQIGDTPATIAPHMSWNNNGHYDIVSGNDIEPHAGPNRYRVEVHGTDYTMSINGQQVTRFTIPQFLRGQIVGFESEYYKIRVTSFRVLKLGKARTPAVQVPPVLTAGLTADDTQLPQVDGHFVTNEEYAQLLNVSVDSLVARGRVLSYIADFSAPANAKNVTLAGITSSVAAFTSADNAHTAYVIAVSSAEKSDSGFTSYVRRDLSGVGDEATLFAFNYNGYDQVVVLLRVGMYTASVNWAFMPGDYTNVQAVCARALLDTLVKRLRAAQ